MCHRIADVVLREEYLCRVWSRGLCCVCVCVHEHNNASMEMVMVNKIHCHFGTYAEGCMDV